MGPSARILLAGTSVLAIAVASSFARKALADTTISNSTAAQQNWSAGNFTVTNTGTISAPAIGVNATGTGSGTLTVFSGGKISAATTGVNVSNTATIGLISNSGIVSASVSSTSGTGAGINNSGIIGTLTNNGTITSSASGWAINNSGSIGALTNSGTITSSLSAQTRIRNSGTIGTLTNRGLIAAGASGGAISSSGSIGTLINTIGGTITGNSAISIGGNVGTLINSGTISAIVGGAIALNTSGSIGGITNSGVIAGTISNLSTNALTIAGGTGSTFGLLTGYNSGTPSLASPGTVGSISIPSANLVFSSGNLLLNDNVTVGAGHTVSNTGAVLKIQNPLTITGKYSQSGGGLVVVTTGNGTSYGYMTVSSNATVANAAITISGSGLTTGETFSIVRPGGTGSYTGDTATVSGTNGLSAAVSTSGNNLIVTLATATDTTISTAAGAQTWSFGNFTVTSTGSISGGATGIAASGTLGLLSNSGSIGGTTYGVNNSGSIGTISNAAGGTISGGNHTGIFSSASIGALSNSGLISGGANAINNSGSIGTFTNSGTIAGNILNSSANPLTIAGGSGATFGVLTGYNSGTPSLASPGTVGTITSTSADLLFSSGNLLLNDDINVGATHTVTNGGATLQLSNPVSITGAYSQSGGGLAIATTNRGNSYGYLTISGNASVANAAITISGSGLAANQTFTIVRPGGTGSYSGNTATVSGTSGLRANITDVGNDLVVTLAGSNYATLAQSAGGAAVGMGPALDAVSAASSPAAIAFQNTVLATLDVLPAAAQPAAVKQLAPTQLAPALVAATQAATPTTAAVEQHELAALRGGGVGAAAGSGPHDYAVWSQVLGGTALRDSTAGADGYRSTDVGLMFGLERQVTPALLMGVAVSWLQGHASGLDGAAGSATTTNTYQVTGYGVQRWGPAFVDAQAGVGYINFRQGRAISFLGTDAQAAYDGQLYLAKLGAGYDIPAYSVTLTPVAGLRFLRAVSDGYTETGAGNADLSVERRGVQSLTQDLGAKLTWDVTTDWGVLKPEARLAWVHDYTQGPIASSGLIGGEAFTSTVTRPAADGARLNLAATLDASDAVTLRAEFEGELRHDYQSATGLLKASLNF